MELIKECPKCGSGDVHWCNISVRPYCNECGYCAPVNFGTREDAIRRWNESVEMMNEFHEQAKKVRVYEESTAEVRVGFSCFVVEYIHRDWNPLPGHTPPDGTVWEGKTLLFGREIVAAGESKEELLNNIRALLRLRMERGF